MCKLISKISLLLIFAILWQNSIAQSDSSYLKMEQLSVEDLLSIDRSKPLEIISASRSGRNSEELPVSVYVITKEEILNNGYNTLVDALKNVPGIRVSQPGSALEGETFLMRGLFGNNYTKILINNLPIQPSAASGMPVGAQLPIKQAERIEIIFGPASAIYGADAMAGVINIITKEADQTIFAQADLSTGQFGYGQINTMFGGKLGRDKNILQYSFYASSTERDDLNVKSKRYYPVSFNAMSKNFGKLEPETEMVDIYDPQSYTSDTTYTNSPYYVGTLRNPELNEMPHKSELMGVQLRVRNFRMSYDYMYRRDHASIGVTPLGSSYVSPYRFIGEDINRFTAGYDKTFEKLNLTGNFSYLKYQMDRRSAIVSVNDWVSDGLHYKFAASDDAFAEQLATLKLGSHLELLAGVSYQYSGYLPINNYLQTPFTYKDYKPFSGSSIEVKSPISKSMHPALFSNLGSYIQLYYSREKTNLIIGSRYDKHSQYGYSFNPRIALSRRVFDRGILRGSYATAFKSPSSYQVYNSLAIRRIKGSWFEQVPNFNLKPEKLYSYELGYKYVLNNKISLDASVYSLFISNLINNSLIFDTASTFLLTLGYLNDVNSSGTLYGSQIAIHFNDLVPSVDFNLDVFANYSKGKEVLPLNRGLLSDYRMVPRYMGQVNLSFSPIKKLNFSFNNTILGKWLSRAVVTDPFDSDLTYFYQLKGYYSLDFVGRYKFSSNFQGFVKVINVFDEHFGGIDASGSFDDLLVNPQLGRNIQFGLSYRLN